MSEEDVSWRIVVDGFPTREAARKIASLIRRVTDDNEPEDDIRIEIHGYTVTETD